MAGIADVVIILKTGLSEIYEKLPIHLATTFVCAPDYLVYSDLPQTLGPIEVRDALAQVSQELREGSRNLAQYLVLQHHVQAGGDAAQLRGEESLKLDKWKFLPMISDAYRTFGQRKSWYIFVEADTALVLHNLLIWLQRLDPSQAVYAGAPVVIGDTEFGHGGSGFLLSGVAAEAVTDLYGAQPARWEAEVGADCCGDKMVAEVLLAASPGIRLLRSFPQIQGETFASLDWSPTHWCMPAVTWHHLDAADIDRAWHFEQNWRKSHGANAPILVVDYFDAFVHPRLAAANWTMRAWDNLSKDWIFEETRLHHESYESAAAYERFCREREGCLQWAWSPGSCQVGLGAERSVRAGLCR